MSVQNVLFAEKNRYSTLNSFTIDIYIPNPTQDRVKLRNLMEFIEQYECVLHRTVKMRTANPKKVFENS